MSLRLDIRNRPAGESGRGRFVAMDGLRGLAALSVVAFHLTAFGMYPSSLTNPAVDLFFMLSGFVVADAYEKRIPGLGIWGFFKVRMARLYPTYGLSLLIIPVFTAFIWLISTMPPDAIRVYISLPFQALYLPSPPWIVPPNRPALFINGPGWSLFWEMFINILYAMALPRLRTWLLIVVIATAAAGLAMVASTGGDLLSGSDWPTWWIGGIRVFFGFPLGVLLHRIPRASFATPFPVLAILAAVSTAVPPLVALLAILPLTVWLSTNCRTNSPIAAGLGELSYPLYAIHVPLFEPLSWIATRVLHIDHAWQGSFLFVCTCAIAWVVLIYWDRPARDYLRARITRPKRLSPAFDL